MNKPYPFSKPVLIALAMLVVLFYSDRYLLFFIIDNFSFPDELVRPIVDLLKLTIIITMLIFYNKTNPPVTLGKIKINIFLTMILFLSFITLVYFFANKKHDITIDMLLSSEETPIQRTLFFIFYFFIPPVIQEVVFRGVLFDQLKKYSTIIAFLVPTVFFLILYSNINYLRVSLLDIIALGALSILLTLARIKTGGVLLPIILNSLFNMAYFKIKYLELEHAFG